MESVPDIEIAFVYAGPDNCTENHLQPFQSLCQPHLPGFHRFYRLFSALVPYLAHFSGILRISYAR
jgi:hypothetical protein